jgi:RimJ/RimL family protein N-acetyltransferase
MKRKPHTARKKLAGKKVHLRPFSVADATARYVRWLNDAAVNQYLESRFERATPRSARKYVQGVLADEHSYFFAIIEAASGEHIGNIKLGPVHPYHKTGDIGYFIGEKWAWGKGYATEAVLLVMDFAFKKLKLRKITAGIYAPNAGSARVLEKAGFKREGLRVKQYRRGRGHADAVMFGKLNPKR